MITGRSSGSASSSRLSDPRLIIRPTQTQMHSILPDGTVVAGSLSPTIPGKNIVQLVMHSTSAGALRPTAITLTAAMLGMHMIPVRAVLTRTARGYAGAITLPMFGVYRVSVALQTPAGTQHGIIIITLPLPRL